MYVKILVASSEDMIHVLAPDGNVYARRTDGPTTLALDPTRQSSQPFDYNTYALAASKFNMHRVVGPNGNFYPDFEGDGVPPLEFATLADGEPVYKVVVT